MGFLKELLCVWYIVKVSTLVVIDSLGSLCIPDDARQAFEQIQQCDSGIWASLPCNDERGN